MRTAIIALLLSLFANSSSFANLDSLLAMCHAKVMRLDNFSIRYRVSTKPILKGYSHDIERSFDIYSKPFAGKKEYSFKLSGDTNLTIIHDKNITYYIDTIRKKIDTLHQNWDEALSGNMSLIYLPLLDDYYISLLSNIPALPKDMFRRGISNSENGVNITYFKKFESNILYDSTVISIKIDTNLLLPVYMSENNFGSFDTGAINMNLIDFNITEPELLASLSSEIAMLVQDSGFSLSKLSFKRDEDKTKLIIGGIFPDLELRTENGNSIKLYDINAKIVVLDFWYMSCLPCIASIPNINDISHHFSDDTVRVVSINPFDESSISKLSGFKKRYSVSYPTYFCNRKVTDSLDINGFPRIIILDSDKRITHLNATPYFLPNIINGLVTKLSTK